MFDECNAWTNYCGGNMSPHGAAYYNNVESHPISYADSNFDPPFCVYQNSEVQERRPSTLVHYSTHVPMSTSESARMFIGADCHPDSLNASSYLMPTKPEYHMLSPVSPTTISAFSPYPNTGVSLNSQLASHSISMHNSQHGPVSSYSWQHSRVPPTVPSTAPTAWEQQPRLTRRLKSTDRKSNQRSAKGITKGHHRRPIGPTFHYQPHPGYPTHLESPCSPRSGKYNQSQPCDIANFDGYCQPEWFGQNSPGSVAPAQGSTQVQWGYPQVHSQIGTGIDETIFSIDTQEYQYPQLKGMNQPQVIDLLPPRHGGVLPPLSFTPQSFTPQSFTSQSFSPQNGGSISILSPPSPSTSGKRFDPGLAPLTNQELKAPHAKAQGEPKEPKVPTMDLRSFNIDPIQAPQIVETLNKLQDEMYRDIVKEMAKKFPNEKKISTAVVVELKVAQALDLEDSLKESKQADSDAADESDEK